MARSGGSQSASSPFAHHTTIKLTLKNNEGQPIVLALILWNNEGQSIVLALILWNHEGQYVGFAHCLTQRMPPKHGEGQKEGMGLTLY